MADGLIQVPADSTGKKVDTSELTVGANTVERQRINLSDPVTAAAIASVDNADPASTEYGLTIRPLLTGCTSKHVIAAATNNAAVVKASAGRVIGWTAFNNAAYPVYVKLYNKATAPAPATDNALLLQVVGVQAGVGVSFLSEPGVAYATGIGLAIVKGITDTDNTSTAASDCTVDILYK